MIPRSVSSFVLAIARCAPVAVLALALLTPRRPPHVPGTPATDTLVMFPAIALAGQPSGNRLVRS